MGDISERQGIRWLPHDKEPTENTSTLVLTSAQNRFVDLRINKFPDHGTGSSVHEPERSSDCDEACPGAWSLDRIDWAIAGTSVSQTRHDGSGTPVRHAVFHHWIDSRTSKAESVKDEGDMYPQPDGSTLETGRMVNPDTGLETDYEEVWRAVQVESSTNGPQCVVLELYDDDDDDEDEEDDSTGTRGMAIRLGQYCQAMMRAGDDVTVERWVRRAEGTWDQLFRTGHGHFPNKLLHESKGARMRVGDQTDVEGTTWTVVEYAEVG